MSDSNLAEFVAFAEDLADANGKILLAGASQVPEVDVEPAASLVMDRHREVPTRLAAGASALKRKRH